MSVADQSSPRDSENVMIFVQMPSTNRSSRYQRLFTVTATADISAKIQNGDILRR